MPIFDDFYGTKEALGVKELGVGPCLVDDSETPLT